MSALRFLLDENVAPIYATELLRREPGMMVWRVGIPNAPSAGTLDPEILIWCERHSFILVTNNRKSMPQHLSDHLAAGNHSPGIIILNADRGIGANLQSLLLIWAAGALSDYSDRLTYLNP